jgi:hypothetical protein
MSLSAKRELYQGTEYRLSDNPEEAIVKLLG